MKPLSSAQHTKTFPEILKEVLVEQSKSIIGHYTTDAIVTAIDKIAAKRK